MRRIFVGCFSALWLTLAATSNVRPQSNLEKLRVAYSAIGGSQAAVWIPYEAGIFRKYGLDIELLYIGGGGRAAQVIQSGEVPIGLSPAAPSLIRTSPAATSWSLAVR